MKNYIKIAAKSAQAVILSLMLVMPVGLTNSSRVAAQAQYCEPGFFQYTNNGTNEGLKKLDPTTGSYANLGDGVDTNAVGYNTADGFIYGIALGSSNLVRINTANGSTTVVSQPTNASNPGQTLDSQIPAGEDITVGDVSGGKLYTLIGGDTGTRDMFVIDIATNTFTRLSLSYPNSTIRLSGDMVVLGNYAYSVDANGADNGTNTKRFMRIDLTTGVVSTMYTTNFGATSNTFGAQWIAKDTDGTYRMFTYENNTGRIYEVVNFQSTTPGAISFQLIANTAANISSNDGASCPDAPVPDFPIKAVDDSDVTDIDVPVDVNWIDNDDEATDGTFELSSFDTTSANGGTITDNGDGTFHYTPPAGFTGVDTFTYKICLTGIVGEPICDTATVTITIVSPKLNVEKLVDEAEHQAGDVVTYTINYSNSGDGVANNAILTETIPANTKYAGADLGEEWSCNNGDPAGTTCVKSLGNLAAAQAGVAYFTVKVDSPLEESPLTITNTVVIDADNADPANSSVDINVKSSPVLDVTKDDDDATSGAGGTVVYTITYTNTGTKTEPNAVLTETVPANTTYTGVNEDWSCPVGSPAGTSCTYSIGALAPGQTGEVKFSVTVDEDVSTDVTEINNTVVLSGEGGEDSDSDDEQTPLEAGDVLGEVIYNNPIATSTPTDSGEVLGSKELANTGEFAMGMLPFGIAALMVSLLSFIKRRKEQEA